MARIVLGALTTLNLSTHLDAMFSELYTAAGGDFSASPFIFIGNGTGSREVRINGGTSAAQGANLVLQRGGAAQLAIGSVDSVLGTGGSDIVYYAYATNAQRFYTNGSERVRIDSSGNLEVGSSGVTLGSGTKGRILSVSGSAVPGIVVQGAGMNQGVIGFGTGSSTFQIQAGSDYGGMNFVVGGTTVANITTTAVTPNADNTITMGTAAKRWSVVYAGTGTINTSDAREKTKVARLTPAELKAAQEIARKIGAYKFRSAVAEKGDAARIHAGLTVQRAIEIMEDNGLEPFAYAFICHDEWDAEGDRPAGDRYGFRMDELMAFVCAGQQAAHDALESRIQALEGAK